MPAQQRLRPHREAPPRPPEATAGSLPQKTPDQHTSAAGETTGAEAPLTRAATSKSRDPSTAPGAPPTRSAQGHREPPDRQTTTATDPSSTDCTKEPNLPAQPPRIDADEFLNPTPLTLTADTGKHRAGCAFVHRPRELSASALAGFSVRPSGTAS